MKIPKGIVEDVLVKVDKFYYRASGSRGKLCTHHTWETIFSHIKCHHQFLEWDYAEFGNMTLEVKIFHLSNKHANLEEQGPDEGGLEEIFLIGTSVGEHCTQ